MSLQQHSRRSAHIEWENVEKLYWDIGEVAKIFGVRPSLIRFWLQVFNIEVKRNTRGERKFTKDDMEKVSELYWLLKVRKFTLAGAKQELKSKPVTGERV